MSETLIHLDIIIATLQLLEKPAIVSSAWGVKIGISDMLLQPE